MAAQDADLLRKDGSSIQIGDRIASAGDFGTVKFIGCVPPTKGTWLGVEWDDSSRGKHDGSHEGVRYFETNHPTSGSFVRPKKVDLGQDCLLAIQGRYGMQENGDAGVDTEELFVLSADNKATVVEMVGAHKINQKQSQFSRLKEVSVRAKNVYGIESDHLLSSMLPNIIELDLSLNLLGSWDMVAKICKQLPHLYNLHVSENRLAFPTSPQQLAPAFSKVKILYLNKMALTWQQVLQSCSMFPSVELLYLCNNCIETLREPKGCLQHLTMITLEANRISSWEEVLKLGRLRKLQTLVITDNPVEKIYFPDAEHGQKSQLFPSLKTLFLTGKNLKEFTSFDELNKLEQLEQLQFGHTPIPSLGEVELVREIAIAKVAKLARCNRTMIGEQERRGAEIDYLKRYGPDWLKCGGNQDPAKNNPSPQFSFSHPRFQELVFKWGAPENSEMIQQTKSLKDTLITLKIFSPQDPGKGTLEKKLPATMLVQKLKTLIQRLYRLDCDFTLSYISQKMQGPEVVFDNELRQLSFYSVESGDTIQVKW
ncbi:tubulin-specific chaperone E-like [Babylonia areolata]|uniref:tubulin-specific chaperone E-like n=1 Tax=Babylonia areolata TaxID=304850 RepID=UPI003FD67248